MAMKYGFGTTVPMDFERAFDVVTEAFRKEGFGVLTDIDVQITLKQKLGEDMPPYRILGACNPPLAHRAHRAHRALSAESSIGLLLPCNVVVRQEDSGMVLVECMDLAAVFDLVGNPAVTELAG